MEDRCQFHPTRAAHFYCPFCHIGLCPECVIKREKGGFAKDQYIHLCSKCNRITEWIGAATLIEPFWKRLSGFFTYPFHWQPLLLIVGLSLVGLLGLTMAASGGLLFGLLIMAMMLVALLKYSYEVLNATARGNLHPPKISSQTISENIAPVIKQFFLIFIVAAIIGMISSFAGSFVGNLAFLFFKLFFYSMLILLVTTESLFTALNPLLFVPLTIRIGWGYLVMYFLLFLLGDAPYYLSSFLVRIMPESFLIIALFFMLSFCYYTIVAYHLMGYVLLQYHAEIGYKIDYEDFTVPAGIAAQVDVPQEDVNEVVLRKIQPLIQEGKLEEAVSLVQEQTQAAGITNLKLSERYFNLLKLTRRKKELLDHAVIHLQLLEKDKQMPKAYQLFGQCLKLKPDFKPASSTLFKIGNWLNETGKAKAAIGVYNRLIKTYPGDTIVPMAYFRSAQIFNDRLMSPDRARKILNGILSKYPEHDIVPKVKAYLASI